MDDYTKVEPMPVLECTNEISEIVENLSYDKKEKLLKEYYILINRLTNAMSINELKTMLICLPQDSQFYNLFISTYNNKVREKKEKSKKRKNYFLLLLLALFIIAIKTFFELNYENF